MPAWDLETERLIQSELEAAREARRAGFEGRARVCARRAAGAALRTYYFPTGGARQAGNAYQLLQRAFSDSHLPADIAGLCQRLAMRVDNEYSLPDSVDLISDAVRLIEWVKQSTEGVE